MEDSQFRFHGVCSGGLLRLAAVALLAVSCGGGVGAVTPSISLSVSASTVVADGGDQVTLTAVVTEGGVPAPNVGVTFAADLGDIETAEAVTNEDGIATTTWDTIDAGTATVSVCQTSDPGIEDSESITATAAPTAVLTNSRICSAPHSRNTNHTFKFEWDSKLKRGKKGVSPPLVLKYAVVPPGATEIEYSFHGAALVGSHQVTTSMGTPGTWTVQGKLYVRDADGQPDMSRLVATAQDLTFSIE